MSNIIKSNFVGKKGEQVEFNISSYEMTSCWDNPWGITYLYTFKDILQNVFIWKTSRRIDKDITLVRGTIKDHITYNNINETELYYCRVQ